jgi:hypothetical protein
MSKKMLVQNQQTLKTDIILRSIKILDIAFITFLYGLTALIMVVYLDKYVYVHVNFNTDTLDENKSNLMIFFEILIFLAINGICAYFVRNLIQMIPFPFEGVYGFRHEKVNEVKTGAIIVVILTSFSVRLQNKIILFRNNLSKDI